MSLCENALRKMGLMAIMMMLSYKREELKLKKRLPGRHHRDCIIRSVKVAYSSIKVGPERGYDYPLDILREKTPGKRKG